MTTITDRVEYANASAHDFADPAIKVLFELLSIDKRIKAETVAKNHSVLLAALIEAAAKTYAVERQYEAAERIADGLFEIADTLRRVALAIEENQS